MCLVIVCHAVDKMKLDLRITENPQESSFYFNGTGSATFERDGQRYSARMDIDFEHPKEGRYGSLLVYDAENRIAARYAMTGMTAFADATSKRVILTGIDGTKGKIPVNVDFHRDGNRNYSMLIPQGSGLFTDENSILRLEFDSDLRIAPRVKTAEEVAEEQQAQAYLDQRKAREEMEANRKAFRKNLFDTLGALVGILSVGFALWMAPQAYRRRRLGHLILFTALALLTTTPPFVLLPVLPAYFWWYYNLYITKHTNRTLNCKFRRIFYCSTAIFGAIFYVLFGIVALAFVLLWLIAGFLAYLLIYSDHAEKARCHQCAYYGANHVVSSEMIDEQIKRVVTRKKVYDSTEERHDKIIEWYKIKYNVRIEAHQQFRDFRRCEQCGEFYITFRTNIQTLSNRTY